ncbi:MAG: molecular chaperone DnaK [Gammaproteobacteria bacterium BRH_c0]|nr:MAG: molecular chaperone DnaK [Gammaproteobacteria bacterium BRH_c0]
MTEQELLKASPAAYMNIKQRAFFRERLQVLRQHSLQTIEAEQRRLGERPELNDEADLAQYEETSRMALRVIERETRLLRKIDKALERMRTGNYGYCLESGEPIGIARLLIRPTAEYCADVKTQMEEREKHYGKRR